MLFVDDHIWFLLTGKVLAEGGFQSYEHTPRPLKHQRLMKGWHEWRQWRWPCLWYNVMISDSAVDLLLKVQHPGENHRGKLLHSSPSHLWRAVLVFLMKEPDDCQKRDFTFLSQFLFVCLMISLSFVVHTNCTLTSASHRRSAFTLIRVKGLVEKKKSHLIWLIFETWMKINERFLFCLRL